MQKEESIQNDTNRWHQVAFIGNIHYILEKMFAERLAVIGEIKIDKFNFKSLEDL